MNLKIYTKTIEQEAVDQINLISKQSAFVNSKIRIMPDAHSGKGCVIGFTSDISDKIIPNIVGVDIGCGMLTIKLGKIQPDFIKLDKVIRKFVPSGRNVHDDRIVKFPKLQQLKCYRELKNTKRLERSIGTLGGGNHFIELDKDNSGNVYLVIHSGSRNLGKQVAEYYQNLAYELLKGKDKLLDKQKQIIQEYKQQGKRSEIQDAIKKLKAEYKEKEIDIPKDLCYLQGEYKDAYMFDMKICQEYAELNRNTMAKIIIDKMGWIVNDSFQTIHNYIDHESNIVRKGSVSAQNGEKLLIPINMRDGSLLCVGKGNADWNYSAPHGAGRLMSRTKAKATLNLNDYQDSMKNIFTTCVCPDTIDESPMVYKDINEIIECIRGTVDIVDIIKPIYNFKANS